jgi:hypothetical protein
MYRQILQPGFLALLLVDWHFDGDWALGVVGFSVTISALDKAADDQQKN